MGSMVSESDIWRGLQQVVVDKTTARAGGNCDKLVKIWS